MHLRATVPSKKKCPKKWKKSKMWGGGGGISAKNKKVHNAKCRLFDKRRGVRILSVFNLHFVGPKILNFPYFNFFPFKSEGGGPENY